MQAAGRQFNPDLLHQIHGGCRQVVKAPRCDRGTRGFDPHQPPQQSFRRGSSAVEHAPDKREVEISKLSPDTILAHVAQLAEQTPCKGEVERSKRLLGHQNSVV